MKDKYVAVDVDVRRSLHIRRWISIGNFCFVWIFFTKSIIYYSDTEVRTPGWCYVKALSWADVCCSGHFVFSRPHNKLKLFTLLFPQVPLQAVWIFSLPQALPQIGQPHCWQTAGETVTSSSTLMDDRQPMFQNWWCLRTSLNNSPSPHGWSTAQVLAWEARRRRCYATRTRRVRVLVITGLWKECFTQKWKHW